MAWNIYPSGGQDWEIDPSVRDSTHIWTKGQPVDTTLAIPGTAENLWLANTGIPTVNIATNPSFETGAPPTGYTLVGSAIAQSAVVARNGTNSLEITPDNAAAGEGAYWSSLSFGRMQDNRYYFVVSAYFNDNAGSGDGARIVIANSSGTTLANGNTVALAASWSRSTAFFPLTTPESASYRVYFVTSAQHGTVFYVDSFQAEILRQSAATTYVDGSVGIFNEWEGTAHASMSRRMAWLKAIRGYTLHTTRDLYIAEDRPASTTDGGSRFVRAGTDFWEDFPINITSQVSIINSNPGEAPRVYGVLRGVHSGG